MPRANPIPQRELEIARRFQEARLRARATRSYVAVRVGVDSQAIARIELGRSILRADLAARFCEEFNVSQRWLATGVGAGDRNVHVPATTRGGAPGFVPDGSFSQWYDHVLAPYCEAFYRIDGPAILRQLRHRIQYARPVDQRGAGTPEAEAAVLRKAVADLLDYLVVVLTPTLFAWLFRALLDAAAEFIQESGPRLEHDNKAIGRDTAATARMIESAPSARPLPGEEGRSVIVSEHEYTKDLTNISEPMIVTRMQLWLDLKSRIQRLVTYRGAKAELARYCQVTPQAVATWLDPESDTEPSAESTLMLLEWAKAKRAQNPTSPITSAPKPLPKKPAPAKAAKTGKR
jgi:transcriptional regulator with XRE-family HTH domain